MIGAAFILALLVYVAVMQDASLCYQVAGCPSFRHLFLGY